MNRHTHFVLWFFIPSVVRVFTHWTRIKRNRIIFQRRDRITRHGRWPSICSPRARSNIANDTFARILGHGRRVVRTEMTLCFRIRMDPRVDFDFFTFRPLGKRRKRRVYDARWFLSVRGPTRKRRRRMKDICTSVIAIGNNKICFCFCSFYFIVLTTHYNIM